MGSADDLSLGRDLINSMYVQLGLDDPMSEHQQFASGSTECGSNGVVVGNRRVCLVNNRNGVVRFSEVSVCEVEGESDSVKVVLDYRVDDVALLGDGY